jgi:phage terminase large subunit-like protein
VIAPTYGDARDTCIEGSPSSPALLDALGPAVETWNRSMGELRVANGSIIRADGADDGALRVQGRNLRGAWCDEIGLWKQWRMAWEESIGFAVRLDPALILATGTPKGKQGVVKLLLDDPVDVVITTLLLEENEANLSPMQIASLRRRHEGTRLGRQELHGEILDDVEGALWAWAMIDDYRCALPTEGASRTVVAVDPAITSGEDSDETGILAVTRYGSTTPFPEANLVAGEEVDHAFVRADRSGRYSPRGWAAAAIELYHELKADRIVYEKNQGGEMVASTIRSVDPNVPLSDVWASQGKRTRAEPVSALYEQGRVHHVEPFPELESEMTAWVPGEPSPSRMDALVWSITDLMLEGTQDSAFANEQDRTAEVEAPITAGIMDRRW